LIRSHGQFDQREDMPQYHAKNGLHAGSFQGIQGEVTPSNSMADREDKNAENINGKFYVDSQCIDCDLCRETAPANFTRADDEGYSFVFKQPENDEEVAQCREAMEGCPVEAIGEDGEE
jgi:ferredoxin